MDEHRLTYADAARIAGTGLISAGLALLVFVFITYGWGDPITGIENHGQQAQFGKQFSKQLASFGVDKNASLTSVGLDCRTTRVAARSYRSGLTAGEAAAQISIPRIGMKRYIVTGADESDLARGPGFYQEANFPGTCGAVAIAGHRTTHGAPFLDIDKVRVGDPIHLTLPYGTFTYTVTKHRVILPNDWSILNPGADQPHDTTACVGGTCEYLVMTACDPKYSASHRYALFAHLTEVQLSAGQRIQDEGQTPKAHAL